jgi:hypothetical protein
MADTFEDSLDQIDDWLKDLDDLLGDPVPDPIPATKQPTVETDCNGIQSECDDIVGIVGGSGLAPSYTPPGSPGAALDAMKTAYGDLKVATTDTQKDQKASLLKALAGDMKTESGC